MRIGRKAPIAVVALSLLATCTDLPTEHADTTVAMPIRVNSPDDAELLTEAVVSDGRVVLGSETLGYVDPGKYREADTAITSRSEVCYYLVTYIVLTGEILEVEFLFCTGGGGGASSCTADQRAIADEYAATLVYPDWSCTKFQHTGITYGTGTHGHSTGFLHDDKAADFDAPGFNDPFGRRSAKWGERLVPPGSLGMVQAVLLIRPTFTSTGDNNDYEDWRSNGIDAWLPVRPDAVGWVSPSHPGAGHNANDRAGSRGETCLC